MAKSNKQPSKVASVIKFIFKWLPLLSNIGLWGFVLFLLNIHWAHFPLLSFSDFTIIMENPQHNSISYYNKNDPLKVTFILSNDWLNPIDAKFKITKNDCMKTTYTCFNLVDSKCLPYLDLTDEFIFKEFKETQYITVKGSFANCSDVVNVCLSVQETKFPKNDKNKCVIFNPSGLKK